MSQKIENKKDPAMVKKEKKIGEHKMAIN